MLYYVAHSKGPGNARALVTHNHIVVQNSSGRAVPGKLLTWVTAEAANQTDTQLQQAWLNGNKSFFAKVPTAMSDTAFNAVLVNPKKRKAS